MTTAEDARPRPVPAPVPEHAVAFYDSDAAVQQLVGRYVRDGLALGERVLAVLHPGSQDLLRIALGEDVAEQVDWTTAISYRQLGAMFHGYRRLFAEQRATGTTVLRQVHPVILHADGPGVGNPDYVPPSEFLAAHVEQLQPVPDEVGVDLVLHTAEQLSDLRRALQDWLARSPGDDRRDDPFRAGPLLLAVGEVATNALQHGRPPVRVRAWAVATDVRVRVDGRSDGGAGATARYRAAADDGTSIGLLLARGFADTVRVASDSGSTSVGLEFPLGG